VITYNSTVFTVLYTITFPDNISDT